MAFDINTSKDYLRPYVNEFLEIYKNRPIRDNAGGMESPQCFWVWFFLKQINPEVVIESGIWYGQSTWLIEQTCPNARIISIDINLDIQKYRSPRVTYTNIDFNKHIWRDILGKETCSKTLAFIDDHQNNYQRLEHGFENGIGHMIFEDNYPTNHGDVLSLKKILTNTYHIYDINRVRTRHEIPQDYRLNVERMCSYYECPPLFLDSPITRWGDTFESHLCKNPIFTEVEEGYDILKKEQLNYTFIAIVKIHNKLIR